MKKTSRAFHQDLKDAGIDLAPSTVRNWWRRGAPRNVKGFARFYRQRSAPRQPKAQDELDAALAFEFGGR